MATNTLKEFLVAIGFKVDEVQLKNFNDRIQKISERVLDLGQQFAITATGVSASVTKMASDMERLYFASQRTGAGAQNLRAWDIAAQAAGLSIGDAHSAIEGLAATMRHPGMTQLLQSFGVKVDKDSTETMFNLIAKLKQMGKPGTAGYAEATSIAGMYGINEEQFYQLSTNLDEARKKYEDSIAAQKKNGLDLGKETANAHKFMDDMRQAMQRVEDLAMMFTSSLLPAGEKVVSWLDKLVSVAEKADKDTGGWSTIVGGLIAAFGAMKIGMSLLRSVTGGGRGGVLGAAEGLARGASVIEIAEAIVNIQNGMGGGGLGNLGKLGKAANTAEEAEGAAKGVGEAETMKNAKWVLGGEEAVEAGETMGAGEAALGVEGAAGAAAVAPEAAAGAAAIAWPVLIASAATAAIAWVTMNPQKVGQAARAVVDWAKGAWESTETAVTNAVKATKKFETEAAKDAKWTVQHPKEAVKIVQQKTQETVAAATNATSNWWAKVKQGYNLSGLDDNIIDMVARNEGHAKGGYGSYKDIAGYQTIGFGHKIEKGEESLIGKNLTEGEARSMLVSDISKFRDQMTPLVKNSKLNSHQMTALLDFAYNVGIGNFKKSTLLKDVNAGDLEGASREFLKWNKAQTSPGVWTVNNGLSERRQQEAGLFAGHKVEMNQTATIIVQGGDPHTVAQKVKDSQQGLSNDLLRNTVTALDNGRPS
jgi:GH24 family phage-related lysozyme (muramidase)